MMHARTATTKRGHRAVHVEALRAVLRAKQQNANAARLRASIRDAFAGYLA